MTSCLINYDVRQHTGGDVASLELLSLSDVEKQVGRHDVTAVHALPNQQAAAAVVVAVAAVVVAVVVVAAAVGVVVVGSVVVGVSVVVVGEVCGGSGVVGVEVVVVVERCLLLLLLPFFHGHLPHALRYAVCIHPFILSTSLLSIHHPFNHLSIRLSIHPFLPPSIFLLTSRE